MWQACRREDRRVKWFPRRRSTSSAEPLAPVVDSVVAEEAAQALLFDPAWYLREYPDVAAAGVDPWEHYSSHGWRENRDPHPEFDTDWYLWIYEDVARAGVNPLVHFVGHGRHEKRRPSPRFDPDWYLTAYPEVGTSGLDPFTHFLTHGTAQGRHPCAAIAVHAAHPISAFDRSAASPVLMVIVHEGERLHLDRCLRALASTEAPEISTIVLLDRSGESDAPGGSETYPWLTVLDGSSGESVPAELTDLLYASRPAGVLLMSSDTEPLPGFLHALLAAVPVADDPSGPGSPVMVVPSHPALGLVPDAAELDPVEGGSAAVLLVADAWEQLLEPLVSPDTGARRVLAVDRAATVHPRVVTAPDSVVLSHLARRLGRVSDAARLEWDIPTAEEATRLAASLEPRASTFAELTRIQLAACDPGSAKESLAHWRAELARLSPAALANQARWVRYMPGFVGDIVNEFQLDTRAAQVAHRAVMDDDLALAESNVRDHPGSLAAAVAVVVVLMRSGDPHPFQRPVADGGDRGGEEHSHRIPRVLLQAWFDSPLPGDALEMTRTWDIVNPGWEHLIFDTESAAQWLEQNMGTEAERVFREASAVSKADLFRLAYLSRHGGVWADIDDRALQPLEDLVGDHALVATVEPTGNLGNNFIAVTPRHPVVEAAYQQALDNLSRGFAESVWLANGPGLFTRMVARWVAADPEHGRPGRDLVLVDNTLLNDYVKMFEELDYKNTDQAWDVAASQGATRRRSTADGPRSAGYPTGTPVSTPHGPVPVESLRAGDMVLSIDGSTAEVLWNGERRMPVAVPDLVHLTAGCLGSDSPRIDVTLPPDQPLLVDGSWVHPRELIDGVDVTWATPGRDPVTMLHLLEVAHGAPVDVGGLLTDPRAADQERFECENLGEWLSLSHRPSQDSPGDTERVIRSPRQWAANRNVREERPSRDTTQPLVRDRSADEVREVQSAAVTGMRVALHPHDYSLPGGSARLSRSFAELVRSADQAGVSAVALMDHFLQLGQFPPGDPMLEGYTALGFAAAQTSSADVMLLVSGVTHRHPVLLAKAVATLDVLSGGRARLGLGAGWYAYENAVYGLPFPDLGQRFEMLEETLQIVGRMWSADNGPFNGRHFSLVATVCSPMPIRRPPLLIGGTGRRRTLRLVARYADACNLFAGPDAGGPEATAELLAVLRSHCDAEGTDYERISKTILYTSPVGIDPDGAARFADEMRAYARLGIDEVFVMPLGDVDPFRFVGGLGDRVLPLVQQATAEVMA